MQIFVLPFSSGKNVSSFSMLYTVEKNKESIRKREQNMDKVALLSSPPPPPHPGCFKVRPFCGYVVADVFIFSTSSYNLKHLQNRDWRENLNNY